ncbi:histidine--tRNA ligase [Litorilinea aerophila]|uniref:Histidine--tRNA ligase n=1 Tax=Litorilinea aerophila TaxID=1204385 RepID=A0A540VG66_9CHLR|nr:histidine--tRNA ligase [Litorilinea aerophila]MCC9077078.1 histidine--tRNA ligase [Litorilinea aerophila]GIV76178.1 MAG: histidine--tRNA ligase [Litorilinea sp.]
MAKLNTAPLSGMRDFLPQDVLRRNYVIQVIERVYQSYGFEPLETPAMERLSTLLGKYGEEGDKLIFRVLKRGEKLEQALRDHPTEDSISDAGLRYDLTVPLARIVAQYRNELPRVFKRYQIQPVYRADRPAKGRYREFYQCDVDIVGSRSQTVEAEVLAAGAQVLQELGFGPAHPFSIRLNHRGILRGLMEVAGVPPDLEDAALVAIDKLDKIGLDGVREELAQRGIAREAVAALLQTMANVPDTVEETLRWLEQILADSEAGRQGVAELSNVVAYAQHGPAADHLRVDPYLARGLSYYTGTIFEVEFAGFSSSGGGGGRYDNLIGMFSGQEIPACGFSLGLERIILLMEEQNMFPAHISGQPQVLVTQFDESTVGDSLALAQRLRAAGLRVDLYPDTDRYGKQFKYADDRHIRFALLLSPRELAEGVVAVKDLVTGDQVDVAEADLPAYLQEQLALVAA